MKGNRRAWRTQALQRKLGYASDEIKFSKKYEEGMKKNYRNIDTDIATSKENLEEVNSKIKSRRENSTFRYKYLVASVENIKEDVRKKEVQKLEIKTQLDNLHLSQLNYKHEL